jgi:hypothetical protein
MVILFPWGGGDASAILARGLSALLTIVVVFLPFLALAGPDCVGVPQCADQLRELLAAEERAAGAADSVPGIRIRYDDEEIGGPSGNPLDRVDIDVRFDGLDDARQLNASTVPARRTFLPGNPVEFLATWNYGAFIAHAEIRIYRAEDKAQPASIAAPALILPLDGGGRAFWPDTAGLGGEAFAYTVRVYDEQGRFDETVPLPIKFTREADLLADADEHEIEPRPGEGEDRTMIANIPFVGGKVTVAGRNVPPGYEVRVNGARIATGIDGGFVSTQVVAAGEHEVDIAIVAPDESHRLDLERTVEVPAHEFFYVGIADLTIGRRTGHDSAAFVDAAPGEYRPVYRRGRAAFYLKGKMLGRYILTAALDTGEDELDKVFRNLDAKDPRQLLRRLDPDDYYPIYGDDSVAIEDAPTSGRFYVRLEDGRSHVMWGNFKIRLDGVELTRIERGLYGANAELRTQAASASGEAVGRISAFAAQPGTLPQRDEFLGTGGSAYFLKHQDITIGSEQVAIEERDAVSGLVKSTRVLRQNEDYSFDYIQGVILLNKPLASSAGDDAAVKSAGLSGNRNWLVVSYEYTPTGAEIEGYAYGGRAHLWLGDHLRFGATAFSDTTGLSDYLLTGADLLLRFSENSWFEAEWAQSSGQGPPSLASSDGGFAFSSGTSTTTASSGEAFRARLQLDLSLPGGPPGIAGGYYESRQAGFSAPARNARYDERLWGAFVDFGDDDSGRLKGKYDHGDRSDGLRRDEANLQLSRRIAPNRILAVGVERSEVAGNKGADGNGARTDAGIKLTEEISDSLQAWTFGQLTLAREETRRRNDRIGVGAAADLTDRITASGEISWGTSGIGLLADLSYQPTAADRYHVGYRLSPDGIAGDLDGYDPFGRDYGAVVFGFDRAYTDSLSLFGEENYDFLGAQRSRRHAYGVKYAPDDAWLYSAGIEAGEVFDETNGDFERFAVSGSAQYRGEGIDGGVKVEARMDEPQTGSGNDRDTWLAKANLGVKVSPDWRFLARIDAVISESDQSSILDGDYVEASVGFAWRPVENDRWNGLFKYTWLYDLPGPEQENANGQTSGPRQRSHVVSADVIHDVNRWLAVGAKYGVRFGEVDWNPPAGDFYPSTAHLGILRADLHIVHQWDLMLEGRALWLSELEQVQWGAVAGIYRQVSGNLKIGVGYNFGQFSDDLNDLTLDDSGVFFNIIGQF